jgi:hypothetical protein
MRPTSAGDTIVNKRQPSTRGLARVGYWIGTLIFIGLLGLAAAGLLVTMGTTSGGPSDEAGGAPGGATVSADRFERCVANRGVDVSVREDDPYVLSDAQFAHIYGYGVSIAVTTSYSAPLDEASGRALAACAAEEPQSEAKAKFDAARTALQEKGGDISEEALLELPGTQEALTEWRVCMARSGYKEFDSPGQARDSIEREFEKRGGLESRGVRFEDMSAGGPVEYPGFADLAIKERALAVADNACVESVLLPAISAAIIDSLGGR